MDKDTTEELKKITDCYGLERGKVYLLRLEPKWDRDTLREIARSIVESGKNVGIDFIVLSFHKGDVEIIPSAEDAEEVLKKAMKMLKSRKDK